MRNELAYLRDILDACEANIEHVSGRSFEAFDASSLLQDAVNYRLLIIGKSVRNLSQAVQGQISEIPWQQIRRMRNVLVHDYDGVDIRIVCDVMENHLPSMIIAVKSVLPPSD